MIPLCPVLDSCNVQDMTSVAADETRAALKRHGKGRTEAQRTEADHMAGIERWVHKGKAAGLDISEMARLANVSRQTVYTILSGPAPGADR